MTTNPFTAKAKKSSQSSVNPFTQKVKQRSTGTKPSGGKQKSSSLSRRRSTTRSRTGSLSKLPAFVEPGISVRIFWPISPAYGNGPGKFEGTVKSVSGDRSKMTVVDSRDVKFYGYANLIEKVVQL